jgi:hypothetical protein
MNSDSFWENNFVQDNKNYFTLSISILLIVVTVLWFIKTNNEQAMANANTESNLNANINRPNQIEKPSKRRLTIHASDFLDLKNIPAFYNFFEKLAERFDLYIIYLIEETADTNKLLEQFNVLTDDKLIYKHVFAFNF